MKFELSRAGKPGGFVYITATGQPGGVIDVFDDIISFVNDIPDHVERFVKNQLTKEFLAAVLGTPAARLYTVYTAVGTLIEFDFGKLVPDQSTIDKIGDFVATQAPFTAAIIESQGIKITTMKVPDPDWVAYVDAKSQHYEIIGIVVVQPQHLVDP